MERDRFESLVEEALEEFPEEFQRLLENLAVVVEDMVSSADAARLGLNSPMQLLGLYSGVPFTQWGQGLLPGAARRHPHLPPAHNGGSPYAVRDQGQGAGSRKARDRPPRRTG